MKKVIILLFALVCIASAADTVIVNTSGLTITPANVVSLTLFDGVADTIEDSSYTTFGPYRMVPDRYKKAYKGYQYYSGPIGGTTPLVNIAYLLSYSSDIADTIAANWVITDTLSATGSTGYIDLSSKAAKYIWFRFHNYGANSAFMGAEEILYKKDDE